MPQLSYLVRSQVVSRISDPATGFNYWLGQACMGMDSAPTPYTINWATGSTTFWQSYVTSEQLDETSDLDDGTICLIYGLRIGNQEGTPAKFTVFSGTVDIAVDFEISWPESFVPPDTESLADATDDAMVQTFNAAATIGSFGQGVIYNGLISAERGPLRQSGQGWRQRLPYRFHFELQV
jgi:hypothetical protein